MSLGKRLFIGGAAAESCFTDNVNPFTGTSSDGGLALYTLDYDASDASGNYNGDVSNVTFGEVGQINYAASFNGTDSKITLPTGSPFNDSDTIKAISAWIKPDTTTSDVYIFSMSSTTQTKDYFTFDWVQSTWSGAPDLRIRVQNGASTNRLDATVDVTATNEWKHVVAQLGSSEVELYIDGVKQTVTYTKTGSATNSWWISNISYDTAVQGLIGQYRAVSADNADGLIDQVRLFNKALSQSEVTKLYNEEACVYTCTTDDNAVGGTNAAYYKFDNNADDEKGSYDGTWSGTEQYEFGRFGAAASFNGTNSGISIPATASTPIDYNSRIYSISFWIKLPSIGSSEQVIAKYGNTDAKRGASIIIHTDGTIRLLERTSVSNNRYSTSVLTANTWHHVVVSRSTTGVSFFIDGELKVAGDAQTYNFTPNSGGTEPIRFGRNASTTVSYGELELDQVRFFSSTLTEANAATLYAEKPCNITLNSNDPFDDDDCVAYYKLDNNADDSAGSNNLVGSGQTYSSSDKLFGTHSADFDGSTDFLSRADAADVFGLNSRIFTISAWVKVDSIASQNGIIAKRENGTTAADRMWYFEINTSGQPRFLWYDNTNTASAVAATDTITVGQWAHVVVRCNATTITFYINGVADSGGAQTAPASIQQSGTDLWVGRRGGQSVSQYMYGAIDQVRIFDRALDGDEVFKLYSEATL